LSKQFLHGPKIRVRLVWRLVLGLALHLALLFVLAFYLILALNSVRRYAPIAGTEETQIESLNTLPALLGAMDTERRAYQKSGDPRDLALYHQGRQAVENALASLNSPLFQPNEPEARRQALVQQWVTDVGDPTTAHPGLKPADLDLLNVRSDDLLKRLNTVTDQLRGETQAVLADLKSKEDDDASDRVSLMWFGVGTVTVITIVIQYLVAISIISPIQTLSAAVRRLQKGDYTVRTIIRSGDEIENLGETFNSMAENILRNQQELEDKNTRLSSQQEALRNANAGLEERVAEKTGELEEKNQKLSEAARLKDEFLATLSHELRTPLTPVISCAHLLSTDPKLGPDQHKNVQVIDRNARALSRMIDELLDLSAVMNRKLRLTREPTELNEWTRVTLATLRPDWDKKKLHLTFIPEKKPVGMEIDPARLAQVVTNLVTNAIKYTAARGKITVKLTATEEQARIAVTDTGEGLSQDEIDRIFEMFHQSRSPETQNVGGLGVGLTVARALAELHGGGLLAESPGPGKGATFTLWLPRRTEAPPAEVAAPGPMPSPSAADRELLRGKRVLLVEDSADTREALQRIFQRRECLINAAASGEEGLEMALREPPDILISDIGLPGISGLELMTRLRERPEFRGLVAIALSGLGREHDITAASTAGFDAHLLKPVDIVVLDQTLIEALRKRAGTS
jgi:signal transduction histidine kinase/ActR/RegA family two-component response regulator